MSAEDLTNGISQHIIYTTLGQRVSATFVKPQVQERILRIDFEATTHDDIKQLIEKYTGSKEFIPMSVGYGSLDSFPFWTQRRLYHNNKDKRISLKECVHQMSMLADDMDSFLSGIDVHPTLYAQGLPGGITLIGFHKCSQSGNKTQILPEKTEDDITRAYLIPV